MVYETAMQVARINLIDWHAIGQQPFARLARSRQVDDAIGMSPLEYTHTLRLEEAKQMLESTDAPIDAIASEVGYEDAGSFSRLFRRSDLTPAQYRRRFGAMRKPSRCRQHRLRLRSYGKRWTHPAVRVTKDQ